MSGLKTRQISISSDEFIIIWTSLSVYTYKTKLKSPHKTICSHSKDSRWLRRFSKKIIKRIIIIIIIIIIIWGIVVAQGHDLIINFQIC